LPLQVPAVILNAVKDPEETTQQQPIGSFNPCLCRLHPTLAFALFLLHCLRIYISGLSVGLSEAAEKVVVLKGRDFSGAISM
jgi:hypothetical protein